MTLKTATAIIPDPDNPNARVKIVATYGIEDRIAHQSPHITVSGEAYEIRPSGRTAREPYCAGQILDEISSAFPWLAPLMTLHLSDAQTGAPIHALANGWYFLNGEPGYNEPGAITNESRAKAAHYLRTSPDVLAEVRSKSDLAELIDTVLAPAWEQQMRAVLTLYGFTDESTLQTDLSTLTLLYTDDKGCVYKQPLSDLPEAGLLINPETDEELNLIGYQLR